MLEVKELAKIVPYFLKYFDKNEESLMISCENILYCLNICKQHFNLQFRVLNQIICIDLSLPIHRFCIVYDLLSITYSKRIKIKTFLNFNINSIKSVALIYINAIWWEREIWDLFGVFFKENPDLRRILTDYGFFGHPLRKDFPLIGFFEIYYNFLKKKILFTEVELNQEFRVFTFESNW